MNPYFVSLLRWFNLFFCHSFLYNIKIRKCFIVKLKKCSKNAWEVSHTHLHLPVPLGRICCRRESHKSLKAGHKQFVFVCIQSPSLLYLKPGWKLVKQDLVHSEFAANHSLHFIDNFIVFQYSKSVPALKRVKMDSFGLTAKMKSTHNAKKCQVKDSNRMQWMFGFCLVSSIMLSKCRAGAPLHCYQLHQMRSQQLIESNSLKKTPAQHYLCVP